MVKDDSSGRNDNDSLAEVPAKPQRRVAGPKSCMLAIAISAVLGLGSMAVSKLMFDNRNASVLAASDVLGSELARAEAAPGASALRAAGCLAAGAFTPQAIASVAQQLEDENARKKRRPAERVELGTETIVYCAKTGEPIACDALAKRYVSVASPGATFVVTSRTRAGETCAERFDANAAPLGSAPSPNLPMLLPPP